MLTPYAPEIEHWPETSADARPAILLMAYECRPDRGPEAYAGWERVLRAALEFEVHAIVSAESYAVIQSLGGSDAIPGIVHFHTPRQDILYRLLKRAPDLSPSSDIAFHRWHRMAYRLARALHRKHCFSLVHQLNARTFREPGYTWRLGIPFIWGPLSGSESFPAKFLSGLSLVYGIGEAARTMANRLALHRRHVKSAGIKASVILAANTTNKDAFERAFRRPIEVLHETAIDCVRRPETAKFRTNGPLNILWSGDFTTRKALPLLLEALANLGHDIEYRLHILGNGPLESRWRALVNELGISRQCVFLSNTASTLSDELDWAHLYVFTSLRDTSGEPVLEALGLGVPVMCFDHQAAGDLVTPACGIKVPVTYPGQAIAAMASAIRALAQDRTRLLQLSAGACDRARNYLWPENGARMSSIYRSFLVVDRRSRKLAGR